MSEQVCLGCGIFTPVFRITMCKSCFSRAVCNTCNKCQFCNGGTLNSDKSIFVMDIDTPPYYYPKIISNKKSKKDKTSNMIIG